MGAGILTFYREKIKSTWKLAFFSGFFLGLLVHIYKFTNLLPNADALYNFYSSQNMAASGRWFLSIACSLGSWFDLPWVNGILSLVFLGITAALVAEVFSMKNPVLIVLSGGLLVSFPAVTATMAYEFTADGYMLAMALAGLSTCLTRMEYMGRKHLPKQILSALCICLACGIYQAYVSFAFVLAVCYFLTELLENRRSNRELGRWIGTQVAVYGCALAGYYIIWKLCLSLQGFSAASYQGIDRVGVMGASDLVSALVKIVGDFVKFFLEWNILDHGITVYSALNILFLLGFALCLLIAGVKSGLLKRTGHLILALACLAALPVGCYIWYLTSPDVYYHALMLQSVCLIYILCAVIFDRWCAPRLSNWALVLLTVIVLNNSLCANMYYNLMHQSFEVTKSAATEICTRIHLLDDGEVKYVAIYGGLGDYGQEDHFRPDRLRQLGGWKTINRTILSPMFLQLYTDFDLSYYRIHDLEHPLVENDPDIPAPQDWEFRFPLLSKPERDALARTEEFQRMPVWPARDSIQVIGDTVVVKLSTPEPEENGG